MGDEVLTSIGRRDSTSPTGLGEFNWSKSLDESSPDGVLDPTLDVLDVGRDQGDDEAVDDPVRVLCITTI